MAKKMYYTEEETIEKLGISEEELTGKIESGELKVYQDGARRMFKADEIDAIAGVSEVEEEVELTPVDTTADGVSLSEADATKESSKEDTVITAEGISIFDDEDLEIEAADPMAKTQIAPSVEEQLGAEGVGSGSGLLDLTRESDDTSLGEVLNHIDMEAGLGSGLMPMTEEEEPATSAPVSPVMPTVAAEPMTMVEQMDAVSGLCAGALVGVTLMSLLLGIVMLASTPANPPAFLFALQRNIVAVIIGGVVAIVAFAVAGMLMGKSIAASQSGMRHAGQQ